MNDKVYLTINQARSVIEINKGFVHTFVQIGTVLIGADSKFDSILKKLEDNSQYIELSGQQAESMQHGICINKENKPIFIATDSIKLQILKNTLNVK
jgi:hypothetical protein